jgi:PIN domain nuclease of toxin-antitoxin system
VKLLLDTHIWLWSHLQPQRLTARVAKALEDADNELWLSPISVWECLLLIERGRLEVDGNAEAWVERALVQAPMHEAPVTHAVARRSRTLQLSHQDPADRFIAATADVYGLMLVTDDTHLLKGKGFAKLSNR